MWMQTEIFSTFSEKVRYLPRKSPLLCEFFSCSPNFVKKISNRYHTNITRSFLFFFFSLVIPSRGLIQALNCYPPGITRIWGFFFFFSKKTTGFIMRCKRARAPGHYLTTGKGLEKSLEKASSKSLEKSLRWKTSFKASKSFKRMMMMMMMSSVLCVPMFYFSASIIKLEIWGYGKRS